MPIPLPNLDDVTYADLMKLALQRIPAHAPAWTNHNESDPGITLVQLFAYFTEMLIFQTNQISTGDLIGFLGLLGGVHVPGADAEAELKQAILRTRVEQRAVTPADFERHALEADVGVARARCLTRRDLEEANQAARLADRPGHVTVLLLPHPGVEIAGLSNTVRAYLEDRRLLTVKVHVVPVPFLNVRMRFRIVAVRGAAQGEIRRIATAALESFLDPNTGGQLHKGWVFGRSIFVSELYRILARLPGVNYVTAQRGNQKDSQMDVVEVVDSDSRRATRDETGELTSITLLDEELPRLAELNLEVGSE